ncbi:MAG: phosphoadenylyl-sulfate reductase [Deltaproteobacteria bacterium]|nr:phosphoadenylyl-sulfate reductase [Deltaproteobacteria bacterium]
MKIPSVNQELVSDLEKIKDPQELIGEIFKRFKNRAAIGTSGQLTGTVMIDLAVKAGAKPRVFTIDTLRLFKETYELFDAMEKKYGIRVERIKPDPAKIAAMVKEHGEYLFFDSKKKQELCCHLRKVEPNDEVLKTVDVWLTGLRVDQSAARAKTNRFEIIIHPEGKHPILKVAPLVDWTEEKLRDYAGKNGVPVHKLLEWKKDGWYYESLGCVICTTPIGPHEPRRAGRWRWFNAVDSDKECGLHTERKHEDEV